MKPASALFCTPDNVSSVLKARKTCKKYMPGTIRILQLYCFQQGKMAFLVRLGGRKPMKPICWMVVIACLSFTVGCGQHTVLSSDAKSDPQKLPFDRPPQTGGISPSHSLVPSATRIPEGTALTVSLEHNLSSATAHSNDTFNAVLDDPIVIDGQTVVPVGAVVTGRVLDVRSALPPREHGYLRIALVHLKVGEKLLPIATSSLFAKGGSHEERGARMSPASDTTTAGTSKEMVFAPGRRLTFRLTQNVELQ